MAVDFPIGVIQVSEYIYDGMWHMVVVCTCGEVLRSISVDEDLPRICPDCGALAERFGTGKRRWVSITRWWNPRSWSRGNWEARDPDEWPEGSTSAPATATPRIERGRVVVDEIPVEDEQEPDDEEEDEDAEDLSSDPTTMRYS